MKLFHAWDNPNTTISKPLAEHLTEKPISPKCNSKILENLGDHSPHLGAAELDEIRCLLHEFLEVMSDMPGLTNVIEHDVELIDERPFKQHPYCLNPVKAETVRKKIIYLLDNNLSVKSKSSWSSPVVLVDKEDNQHRLCVDYRKVNSVTKPDNYPLPCVIDCLDAVGAATYIAKIDMLKGYWQVPLTPKTRKISAFVTPHGSYECLGMTFGMRSAASTFQLLMHLILSDIKNCMVYLDDNVVFCGSWEDHLTILRKVLSAASEVHLVINLKKCAFAKAKVTYLGHNIGHSMVTPKDSNVQAINDNETPTNKKQVMRFLGMVGYFRRFLTNFADVAAPLNSLMKKGVTFKWSNECETAFSDLKSILTNFPVLRTPDFEAPFMLVIDASDHGVGTVLFQRGDSGVSHPVSYFSKTLDKYQKKYSTIEKATMAIILALQHFEITDNNGRTPVSVCTDHNPLVFLSKFKNKTRRLMRWSLALQDFNIVIEHIKGKDNINADTLSRHSNVEME